MEGGFKGGEWNQKCSFFHYLLQIELKIWLIFKKKLSKEDQSVIRIANLGCNSPFELNFDPNTLFHIIIFENIREKFPK